MIAKLCGEPGRDRGPRHPLREGDGTRTVAVFRRRRSRALHVALADEASGSGHPNPVELPQLGPDHRGGPAFRADAIHPGYGFLSGTGGVERSLRSPRHQVCGPARVGNDGRLGSKVDAKTSPSRRGPIVSRIFDASASTINEAAADRIGYRSLSRRARRGGRGMRVVGTGRRFAATLAIASDEALKAW